MSTEPRTCPKCNSPTIVRDCEYDDWGKVTVIICPRCGVLGVAERRQDEAK